MKVCIIGAFGYGNLGDELVCETLTKALAELGHSTIVERPYPLPEAIKEADYIIFGPGGIFYTTNESHSEYYLMYHNLIKKYKKRFGVFGAGFQIRKNIGFQPNLYPIKLLKYCDFAVMRHKNDITLLNDVFDIKNLEYMPDIAYSTVDFFNYKIVKPKNDKKKIGLILLSNKTLEIAKQLYKNREKDNYDLYVIGFDKVSSPKLIHEFEKWAKINSTTITYATTSTYNTLNLLASMDLVLTGRFHGMVLSDLVGTPVYALEKTYKLSQEIDNHFYDPSKSIEEHITNYKRIPPRLSKEVVLEKLRTFLPK